MTIKVLVPDETLVFTQTAFKERNRDGGSAVLIVDHDPDQVGDESNSNISYDLRVGAKYRSLHSRFEGNLPTDGELRINGQQTVLIETAETLHLPENIAGLVLSKVSVTQVGIGEISTKVDPGYHGRLVIRVRNDSPRAVTLKWNQAFCTVMFITTEGDARLYSKGAKTVTGAADTSLKTRIAGFIEAHPTAVNLGVVMTNLALLAGTIYAATQAG
jgi:dCTP deaminase